MAGREEPNQYVPVDPKYFVAANPISDIFEGEKADLRTRIERLEAWLKDRQRILYDNLDHIAYDECAVDSAIARVREVSPYDPRPSQGLEKCLMDLEMQKRLERAGCWKDSWLVNKELMELMKQEQQLTRRDELLK